MPYTNEPFSLQQVVVPQSNLSSSNGDEVAGTGSIQQIGQLADKNELREKLLKIVTDGPSSTSINPLPQNNRVNYNGVPSVADNSKEIVNSSSAFDKLVINSVYSLAQLAQVPEANDCSNSIYVPHANTPSSLNQIETANSTPVFLVNTQPSVAHASLIPILQNTQLTSDKSMLETNVVKDSVYNTEPILPYNLGPPPPYVWPPPTYNVRPAPSSILETELIKDSCNNGPPTPASTLETNVKDPIHNVGPTPTISGDILSKDLINNSGPPPPAFTLETKVVKDSIHNVGPPPTISVLGAQLRKDSMSNVESHPPAAFSSPDTQFSSVAASTGRAPEPTPTDTGSSLPEVVNVEEEDLDDCMVIKIDLTNCQFPIGKRINNLELVIDDSDDEDNSGLTEVKKAVKSKKNNHKDKSSTTKGNSSVKAKKKAKKPVLKDNESHRKLLTLSDTPASEKISDKSFTSVKSLTSTNDEENDSFCPLIMKVENNCDLDEATADNAMPVMSDTNDGSSSEGVNSQTASSNPKGNKHVVTAMHTETTEDVRSIVGGVVAESSKNISCKSCSDTFPTRLALLNHMMLGHRPKQNQSPLPDELNIIVSPVITNLNNFCHSGVVESRQKKLDHGRVNQLNTTQSNRNISVVHEQSQMQIISKDNPSDQSTILDEPMVYTDSAVESSEGHINPATSAPTGENHGPDGITPLPPLCVRCEFCCIWFSNYSRLMEHLRHEPECKKFHDDLFKKQYGILPQSSRPGASGNKPNIICSSCKRKFATKDMLKRHLNDCPQCNKTSKKTSKSTATKKNPGKTLAEETKKKNSAPENTANAQAVDLTKTTSATRTNSEIDLTCKVCKIVCKDEIILAKHLQNSYECLKPKDAVEKKTNFQFRIQLSGYSNDGGLTQQTNDKVQTLNKQQEKKLEREKTKSQGQQVAPVLSVKPGLYQETKPVLSQPLKQRVEPVQLLPKPPFYGMIAPGQQVAPVTSINSALYPVVLSFPSQPPAAQRLEHALAQQTYLGFTAPEQQVPPVTSYKPAPYQEVFTSQPQLPKQRVEPVQAKQNETLFHSVGSVQQGAQGTAGKPALEQEPKLNQWQPPEQRVEPVQVKPKEFFFGTAPLFSDTDGSDSSAEGNSGDSSSNEDAVVEYKCKHCSNTFAHKSDFKKHLKSHTKGLVGHNSVPKIKCKVCKKKFKDHTGLQAHLLQRRICFLHVTSAYHDSFEKGTNICQMCKKSLPSAFEFSKHCYKSLTCRLRYIDLVLQNIKKAEGSSTALAASNFSGSLCDAKTNPQASTHSLSENSSSGSGSVLTIVNNTEDKALLGNNIKPIHSAMQDKIDLAVQATSSPNAMNSRRCHCCNAEYEQLVQHIIKSKKCLIYYEMHPELQPADNSFCFKCRRRFKKNIAFAKHFCIVYDYECFECGLRYLNMSNLKTHYKVVHPGLTPKTQTQPISSSSSGTASGSNIKETSSLTAFPFNCLICFAQFETLILLMEHSYVHTEEIPFVCTRCNTTFHHYNRYVSHQAYHMRMDKDLGPVNQDSVLLNRVSSSAPSIAPSSETPLLQIETGETTKESSRKLGNDQKKTNPYKCYVCLKIFADLETYKTHVSLHSKVPYISCTICFENFPSQKALKEHSKQHELSRTSNKNIKKTNNPADPKQVEKKTFTCLFCHLVFTDQKNKFDHLAQSVSCKSIMSYMLEKQFFVHPSMNQNMPFKPNQCVFCDEYFPDVVAHIIQTSCLVLFEAGVIKYRSDSTMQNDNNSEQLNAYACDLCNKRFQKKSSLEYHKLSVHKVPLSKKPEDLVKSDTLYPKSDTLYPEGDHLYCFRCKKYFSDANSVKEHSQLSHRLMSMKVKACMSEKNGFAVCTLCNTRFPVDSNRRLILAHMFKVHNEGSSKLLDFRCNVDNNPLVDEISKLKYCCTICGAVLTSSARSSHGKMHVENFISQLLVKSSKSLTTFSVEKCPICKQISHSRKTMKRHLMRHKPHSVFKPLSEQKGAGSNSFKLCACPECKRWFKSEHSLNFHIKKCHSRGAEEILKSSSKNLPTKKIDGAQRKGTVEALKRAQSPIQAQAAELSTYICKLCTKRYTALSNFRSHLNKSHKILNLSNISDFMENKQKQSFKAEDETIYNKTELIRAECLPGFSLKMLISSTCINCHICEASVVAQQYQHHLKIEHGISADQLHECPHCSLKLPYPNLLNDHQYQCQLNCTCLICDRKTSTVKGFRGHLSQKHDVNLSSYTNAHFPCELIKVVNDGLPIVTADCRRSCLACGAMFTEQNEYMKHVMSHVIECSIVLEDYFSMVQTENASDVDNVPQEAGLVNLDGSPMPTLEEVKIETQDCSGVQITEATSDASAIINSEVAAVDVYGCQLNFLSSTGGNFNSLTNVPETDMPNVLTSEAGNEQHSVLPIKSEFVVSGIDLTISDIDSDDNDFETLADTIVGSFDTAQSSGEVLEQRVQRKRSSISELANDPKRRKCDQTVSTLREKEIESQMSANNFLHNSCHFDTDKFHMPSNNSMQNSDHCDTDQSHVALNNSMQISDHFETDQSHVASNNSMQNSDHFDTDQSHVTSNNFMLNSDNFDTDQSHMPSINSMQNSDHFNTGQSLVASNNSIQNSDTFDTDQSHMPETNSVKSADPVDTDRNVFSAFQDNFLF